MNYPMMKKKSMVWVRLPVPELFVKKLATMSVTDVSVEELDCLLQEGRVQLFDVREPSELLDTGKIPRSVNIPRMHCMCF